MDWTRTTQGRESVRTDGQTTIGRLVGVKAQERAGGWAVGKLESVQAEERIQVLLSRGGQQASTRDVRHVFPIPSLWIRHPRGYERRPETAPAWRAKGRDVRLALRALHKKDAGERLMGRRAD